MSKPDITAAVQRVARFYETLSVAAIAELASVYAPLARFKDPFNEVQGIAAIAQIFSHMFETVAAPRFVVTTTIVEGDQAMLAWDFFLKLRGREIVIRGVTHLRFDDSGLVVLHRDYWDAAEEIYERIPVLGALMRLLRRRLAAPPPP